jgi:hypothetical protein
MKIINKINNFINQNKLFTIIIIILVVIYFFLYVYMRTKEYRVIVFDLDETLGNFVELGVFCDLIEKYNKRKINFDEFYRIMDLYPEFLRPKILNILAFLKEKKEKGHINKIYIYTNNQGPKEWTEKIRYFLEKKLNYKLFDKVIGAYKVNGKIIESTRTTHDKTIADLFRSTNIPKNSKICFIDDLYHPLMDNNNVYYINIHPYIVYIPFSIMAERYYKQNMITIHNKYEFVNYINTNMNKYNLDKISKTYIAKKEDIVIGKELLYDLQNFLKIKNKLKTKKNRSKHKNSSRKK